MRRKITAAVLAMSIASLATAALAEDVKFSFVSDFFNAGTVSGILDGLTDGAAVEPTDIVITSAPVTGLSYPFEMNPTSFSYSGSFSVSGGVVTFADFIAGSNVNGDVLLGLGTDLAGNGFGIVGTGNAAQNLNGFSGATYTAPGVPEPSTWAMMLLGFGGLGAAIRSRRTLASATA